jgi:GT2 family glycosyltransferase
VTPVLAIPVLDNPDLFVKCLASIDADVRLIVIDNSEDSFTWDLVPDGAHVIDMPSNIGYPASVNLVIKSLPHEPYWLIANADTEFAPGDLQRLLGATESGDWGWVGIRDWRVFGLTAETVERVGFWDESFHPCYVEDADYERRCTLAGVRWGFIQGETTHVGSVSLRDHRHRVGNDRSYPANVRRYREKWGVSAVRVDEEGFATPFDRGLPGDEQPRLSVLRTQAWR